MAMNILETFDRSKRCATWITLDDLGFGSSADRR